MQIHHRNGAYDVRFEPLEAAVGALPADVRIITDSHIAACYPRLLDGRCYNAIAPGEQSKSLEAFGSLLSWLAASRASRRTIVCALGGGVVGDLAGFVAASYMRGLPLYQIPTTLLAQVDSSVGGKVGIDLPEGKNLAGAFYPPSGVSIAIEALASLPTREFINGMAEVWKYGFIMDAGLVSVLSKERLSAVHPDLPAVVKRCIALKAQVVEEDELETTGRRAILNFGHTVGHAIERVTGYDSVLHGEAISVGMVVETRIGEMIGYTEQGTVERVVGCLQSQGLPWKHDSLRGADALIQTMYGDKKVVAGSLAFSLLTDIGRCKLANDVPETIVREALRAS